MKHPRIRAGPVRPSPSLALIAARGRRAGAQGQTIKIGILYDHSGPFSAAGSLNCWRGAKMMIDYINEKGGVLGKYKIVQVDGDSQSKAEVAINEAERLLNVEKVDILAGVYSSAHAVPLAEKVDKQKKFLWITTAIADAVLKDRNLQYTFRPQPNGSLFGEGSVAYIASYAQDRLKKAPKDVRIAIIYEDGPYGAGVAAANEAEAQEAGHAGRAQGRLLDPGAGPLLARDEAPRRAAGRPLPHRLQPRHHALPPPGEGAGASRARLRRARRRPQPARQAEGSLRQRGGGLPHRRPAGLPAHRRQEAEAGRGRADPGDGEALQGVRAEHPASNNIAPHVSMGFNNMWILLNDVLPRAIQKHGGFGPPRRSPRPRARPTSPRAAPCRATA